MKFDAADIAIEFTTYSGDIMASEPNHLCRDVNGKILYLPEDTADFIEIGRIRLFDAAFSLACEAGHEWFEVLDAHSQEAAQYLDLIECNDWDDRLDDMGVEYNGSDLLIIDYIEVEPAYRGQGVGLLAARHAIDVFARDARIAALRPFPPEFTGCLEPDWAPPPGKTAADFDNEQAKLRFYWERMGFERYADTDIWILDVGRKQPTCAEILKAWRTPQLVRQRRIKHRHAAKSARVQ